MLGLGAPSEHLCLHQRKNSVCPGVACLKPTGNLGVACVVCAVAVCVNRSYISLMELSFQHHGASAALRKKTSYRLKSGIKLWIIVTACCVGICAAVFASGNMFE